MDNMVDNNGNPIVKKQTLGETIIEKLDDMKKGLEQRDDVIMSKQVFEEFIGVKTENFDKKLKEEFNIIKTSIVAGTNFLNDEIHKIEIVMPKTTEELENWKIKVHLRLDDLRDKIEIVDSEKVGGIWFRIFMIVEALIILGLLIKTFIR